MTMTLDGTAGMTAPQGAVYNGLQIATATNASGTAVDFTNIPVWVKRITVIFNGVSPTASSSLLVQIGSGTVTTSGYTSTSIGVNNGSGTGGTNSTAGYVVFFTAADTLSGLMTIVNINGNSWVSSHAAKYNTNTSCFGGGDVTLSGTIDRVRITTVSGTPFDAGTVNIMYE